MSFHYGILKAQGVIDLACEAVVRREATTGLTPVCAPATETKGSVMALAVAALLVMWAAATNMQPAAAVTRTYASVGGGFRVRKGSGARLKLISKECKVE